MALFASALVGPITALEFGFAGTMRCGTSLSALFVQFAPVFHRFQSYRDTVWYKYNTQPKTIISNGDFNNQFRITMLNP